MKLSQLSLADYNQLDSIPVINQDLTASGFTPVANTYYRHTGATTDTFTQGVIYLYDTAYHKLGESGGTTLNQYTFSVDISTKPSMAQVTKILNILNTAIRIININIITSKAPNGNSYMSQQLNDRVYTGYSLKINADVFEVHEVFLRNDISGASHAYITEFINSAFSTTEVTMSRIRITYLNDTEITA